MFRFTVLFFLIACIMCSTAVCQNTLPLSTGSDFTLFYYDKGWQQIMDHGEYSAAEISYRKALSFDEDFLVGQSVLARLTLDLDERLRIYEELRNHKNEITGDERLLLDVYLALVKYTNLRDQNSPKAKEALGEALELGEENFRKIVHTYPNEVYIKAEYAEVLHSLYGARQTLDSLQVIATEKQLNNPFILGFRASLHAELGQLDKALHLANELEEALEGKEVAKTDAVFADIYYQMGKLKRAKEYADRAHLTDPRNLDASRLKEKIDNALQEK